jgi:hypothetical protein
MDPSEPLQSPVQPPAFTESPRNKRKKWLLIGIIILVLIAVAGSALVLTGKGGKKPTTASLDSSVYYDRAGYDRGKLPASIGDPSAIVLKTRQTPDKMSDGTVVIPACGVISQDDIKQAGLRLYPNDYGWPVTQSYLSKAGTAAFAPDANDLPLSDRTMSCSYGIASDSGSSQHITVTVNQPFTVTDGAVADWMKSLEYQQQPDIDGYTVYKKGSGSASPTYLLHKGGNTIELRVDLGNNTSKESNLVKTAVKNLNNLAKNPRGTSDVSYDSPVFKQSIAKACDYVGNGDVKQLSGQDASPLVQEFWPTSVGVADFSKVSDYKTKTNYIRSRCIMTANTPEYHTLIGTLKHTIQVTTTSYENTQAASQGLLHLSVGDNNTTKVKGSGVGEEAYLYKDLTDHQNVLAFRQGRVVVEMLYDFANQGDDPSVADPTQYAAKLSPFGTKIANQLKEDHF